MEQNLRVYSLIKAKINGCQLLVVLKTLNILGANISGFTVCFNQLHAMTSRRTCSPTALFIFEKSKFLFSTWKIKRNSQALEVFYIQVSLDGMTGER